MSKGRVCICRDEELHGMLGVPFDQACVRIASRTDLGIRMTVGESLTPKPKIWLEYFTQQRQDHTLEEPWQTQSGFVKTQ